MKERAKAKRLHPDRNLMRINILMVKIRALETLPTEKVTSAPEPSAGARENAKHFLERHI